MTTASTLMLVLWALIVVSAVVSAWAMALKRGVDAMSEANHAMRARALAHSGMAVALQPDVTLSSPLLNGALEDEGTYQVTIGGEGGRLNLNYFLADAVPAKIAFFKEFLALRGLTPRQREVFVDGLLDWIAPASATRRINAAPEGAGYHPPHRPLQSLDEIPLVAGSGPLVSRPHWRDDFTLLSTGPLDLEWVPLELLALVPGVGKDRARHFVERREELWREGGDGRGYPFRDLPKAVEALGVTREEFQALNAYLGFRDGVVRIHSTGTSAHAVWNMDAVVRKAPAAPGRILWWTER